MASMTSKVTNTFGAQLYIDWIPPHGRFLDDGEEYSFNGDILGMLDAKNLTAMRRHIVAGYVIVENPCGVIEIESSSSSSSA